MSTLNFPTNPNFGDIYQVVNATYTWNGYAWLKTSNGSQTFTNLTATTSLAILSTASDALTVGGYSVITTGTTTPVHFFNTSNSTSTTTGALVVDGGVGIAEDVFIGGRLNSESIRIADTIFDTTSTPVNDMVTTVVDSYPVDEYRSSKYLIQIDEGSDGSANFQLIEILLLVNNTGTVYMAEYGVVTSLPMNAELGTFSANVVNDGGQDIMRLYFTANEATEKTLKVLRIAMTP